ncbi:MAG: hypothetical protein G8345_16470 [Magnetococcales bacterium]|nr:hypothetical protein [Magnetococcales bacterium]NGZ28471.1 hypothetical protein [Magnetococcales bacterium]
MLPLLLGAVTGSLIGHLTGQKLAGKKTFLDLPDAEEERYESPSVINEQVIQEESIILATEDVPLDNRFGNRVLVSEHEFSRSAATTLKIGQSRDAEVSSEVDVGLLETLLKGKLAKSMGTELGGQISRRVRLKFEADPGKFVHYRVVWKQESRRGILLVQMAGQERQFPYMVTYGLYHSVESLSAPAEVG